MYRSFLLITATVQIHAIKAHSIGRLAIKAHLWLAVHELLIVIWLGSIKICILIG